jgi:DNA-directed RNA polymerase beta subunit
MKNYAAIILLTLVLQSCSSEYEDSMAQTQECLEDKYDDGDGDFKYASVQEAITAYDFGEARSLLACYEDQEWLNGSRYTGAKGGSKTNQYAKKLVKIVTAEVTYYMKNGEEALAKAAAQESNLYIIYNEALPALVNSLIDKGEIKKALSILSRYTFDSSLPPNVIEFNDHDEVYNKEANSFNDMINSLFNYALFENDKAILKKCLLLYVPNVSGSSRDRDYDTKNTAIAKLKEAGLRL